MYVTDRLTDKNSLSKKLSSIIYELSMNPSVINIPIDLSIDKSSQKNPTCFISLVAPSINLTYHWQEKLYVIPLIFLFARRYINQ
jgi:hypothetical protein